MSCVKCDLPAGIGWIYALFMQPEVRGEKERLTSEGVAYLIYTHAYNVYTPKRKKK